MSRRPLDPRWVTASGQSLDGILGVVPADEVEVVWAITDVGPAPVDVRWEGPRGPRIRVVVLPVRPPVDLGGGVWFVPPVGRFHVEHAERPPAT